mmetsp:Transcript_16551/g.47093  ORF Transcript_16551/g.47093 Transcript_16551/m.47093 type:complete len:239 (+) Transcript_16551:996-1712(+)
MRCLCVYRSRVFAHRTTPHHTHRQTGRPPPVTSWLFSALLDGPASLPSRIGRGGGEGRGACVQEEDFDRRSWCAFRAAGSVCRVDFLCRAETCVWRVVVFVLIRSYESSAYVCVCVCADQHKDTLCDRRSPVGALFWLAQCAHDPRHLETDELLSLFPTVWVRHVQRRQRHTCVRVRERRDCWIRINACVAYSHVLSDPTNMQPSHTEGAGCPRKSSTSPKRQSEASRKDNKTPRHEN